MLAGEICGNLVADLCVPTDAVVKHLNVFKDHSPGLLAIGKAIVMQAFGFKRAKEAFHRGVVAKPQVSPAIALTAHGCLHAIAPLQCTVSFTAILAATV